MTTSTTTRILLGQRWIQQAPNRVPEEATTATERTHVVRTDVEEVRKDSTVPSRGPEVATATLIVGQARTELAREGCHEGSLEVGDIATILGVEVLEFARTTTSRQSPTIRANIIGDISDGTGIGVTVGGAITPAVATGASGTVVIINTYFALGFTGSAIYGG